MFWSGPAIILVSQWWTLMSQRWLCCTVHEVHSWSLCAAWRICRVWVQWGMSCCPFTPGGVFGSSGIAVLWWLTKEMCVIWALLLIQLHQLQEVCVRQGFLPACCLMSLLLRQINWKLKYFFFCDCIDGTAWPRLGLNSLLWGAAVHLVSLTTQFRH